MFSSNVATGLKQRDAQTVKGNRDRNKDSAWEVLGDISGLKWLNDRKVMDTEVLSIRPQNFPEDAHL